METFYHVSSNKLSCGQAVKLYGRKDTFRQMFDFCSSLVENDPDKIPLVSIFEDFMRVKGISFPNPYSLGSILREVLAEQVRRASFPDRPSRIGAVFVFKNYMDACRFKLEYRREKGVIYRCESIAQKIFTGDMTIITYARLTHNDYKTGFQTFKDSMMQYWSGDEPMKYPETICADPVTILEPVVDDEASS